eukprot:CAMPEP_0184536578 /NCGR_PEP_ID=MMETSP0198_2-20121128/16509_1 /TAXON_ID=1112570 /ORGANISM="Thraustochytrium sp., Strain LLF1b" /LENGTH=939 /DNA_ID=CAMNT_0026929719 /DNA_START=584 /DNA_END=3400 /DNA_ORIENTATION=+
MGILGMVQDSILCQRLFAVFNSSGTGRITFEEFAKGLSVLMKGSVDEKLTFAFAMTDIDGSGEITPQELELTVDSIMRIYAGIMGTVNKTTLDRQKIRKLFDQLDHNNDGFITLEQYKRGMKRHPEFVSSLRDQELFAVGMENVLRDERAKVRRYKRVAKSLLTDVGESVELLEVLLQNSSHLFNKSDDGYSADSARSTVTNTQTERKDSKEQLLDENRSAQGPDTPKLPPTSEQQPLPVESYDSGYFSEETVWSSEVESDDEVERSTGEETDDTPSPELQTKLDNTTGNLDKPSISQADTALLPKPTACSSVSGTAQGGPESFEANTKPQLSASPSARSKRSRADMPAPLLDIQRPVGSLPGSSSFTTSVGTSRHESMDLLSLEERLFTLLGTISTKAKTVLDDGSSLRHSRRIEAVAALKRADFAAREKALTEASNASGVSDTCSQSAESLTQLNPGEGSAQNLSSLANDFPRRNPSMSTPLEIAQAHEEDFIMDSLLHSPSSKHRKWNGFGRSSNEEQGEEADGEDALGRFLMSSTKGSTVFFGHPNFDLTIQVMKGIQMALGRSAAESARPLHEYDFNIKEKYSLVAGLKFQRHHNHKGNAGLKDIDSDISGRSCRFVDYAPVVFAKLREHFGINNEDYVQSIGPGNMLSNLMLGSLSSLAELGSEGKSGSFFYFTSDGAFLIKTVHKEEHKLLRHILPQYYHHMTTGTDSLLCRIVGCHVVRLSKNSKIGANKIYFVVMQNALNFDMDLDRRYDLKGSWVGRKVSEEARASSKTTLKDLDFVELKQKVRIGPERKARLVAALKRDANFLAKKHIIDYSLLVGIHKHHKPKHSEVTPEPRSTQSGSVTSEWSSEEGDGESSPPVPFFQADNGGMLSEDMSETYVMGVIDFLTFYSTKKAIERVGKSVVFDRRGISVQRPSVYASRFIDFIDKVVL